jgi:hypothetical protein
MKFLLVLLFIATDALSMDKLALFIPQGQVNQGALVKGTLIVQPEAVNFPVQKLKGENIGETLYFQNLSPLLKKEGSLSYESEVKVIFTSVPQGKVVSGKIGTQEVAIEWNDISINPVESTGKMLWADFTAPDFFERSWKWVWITLLIILLSFGAFTLWRKFDRKKREKDRRRRLADEFMACGSYEEIVEFWKKKHLYLREFPQLENNYRVFEETLFKFQFKPRQTESEKELVVKAYQKLIEDSKGELRGI